jgi:hypothetical protein
MDYYDCFVLHPIHSFVLTCRSVKPTSWQVCKLSACFTGCRVVGTADPESRPLPYPIIAPGAGGPSACITAVNRHSAPIVFTHKDKGLNCREMTPLSIALLAAVC